MADNAATTPAPPAEQQPAAAAPAETPAAAPAAEGAEGAEGPSKKAQKKAEAKAKKEAEKARRAAEREAAAKAAGKSTGPTEDLAKDNYGVVKERKGQFELSADVEDVNLKNIGEEHVGKAVIVRAWVQNARIQG